METSIYLFGSAIIAPLALTRNGLQFLLIVLLFCYPHRLLYHLLPFNMGLDDFLAAFCFVVLLAKGRIRRFGWPGWMMLVLALIACAAEVTGALMGRPVGMGWEPHLRDMMKWGIRLLTALVFVNAFTDHKSIRRAFIVFLIALIAASGTALASWLGLGFAEWFYVLPEGWVITTRHYGAFNGPWAVGAVGSLGIFACYPFTRQTQDKAVWVVSVLAIMALLVALTLSGTRTGFTGVIGTALLILVFSKHRLWALVLAGFGVLILVSVPFFREQFLLMVTRTEAQAAYSEGLYASSGRLGSIQLAWSLVGGPQTLLFGLGRNAMEWYPHNWFLAMLFGYGLFGFSWTIYFIAGLSRRCWELRTSEHILTRSLAVGVGWGLVASMINGLFNDVGLMNIWVMAIFLLAALVENLRELQDFRPLNAI